MGKDLIVQYLSLGHMESHWLGMSLFRTLLQNHTCKTAATHVCAAADTAADNKVKKYAHFLATTHVCPNISGNRWIIIMERASGGIRSRSWRANILSNEPMETQLLCQRLSMAVQRGNASRAQSLLTIFERAFQTNVVF